MLTNLTKFVNYTFKKNRSNYFIVNKPCITANKYEFVNILYFGLARTNHNRYLHVDRMYNICCIVPKLYIFQHKNV